MNIYFSSRRIPNLHQLPALPGVAVRAQENGIRCQIRVIMRRAPDQPGDQHGIVDGQEW